MQWDIRRVRETGSTNEDAFLLGQAGAPAGIVCVADSQRSGRGRMDRSWFSPPGAGLYCSVLLRPALSLEQAGLLSFCAALAMCSAVRSAGLDVKIKWPNDIVYDGKKICGILSSCSGEDGRVVFAVIGAGLNLRAGSWPDEFRSRAAALEDYGVKADRDALLSLYLDELGSWVSTLEHEGFPPIRRALENRFALLARPVRVSGGQQAEGVAEGIGSNGELLLRLADGTLLPVTCGDVSVRGVNGYV